MDIKNLLGQYTDWFKEEAYITPANSGYTSVAVPLLDRFNDYLQVFVKENGGQIEITDGGAIISNLVMCGMDVSRESTKRKSIEKIIHSSNLELNDENEIRAYATIKQFPVVFNKVLQAMLSIDALYEIEKKTETKKKDLLV